MKTSFVTYTILPGAAESVDFARPTKVTVLMRDDSDLLWISTAVPLSSDMATCLDKSMCPLSFTALGKVFFHSPAQAGRSIGVSLILEEP